MAISVKTATLKKWVNEGTILVFRLADRMRSMRTNGASKNRYSDINGWFINYVELLKTEVPMVCISTSGMYKYLWYVYVPMVCICT